jgi:hypothetical protein
VALNWHCVFCLSVIIDTKQPVSFFSNFVRNNSGFNVSTDYGSSCATALCKNVGVVSLLETGLCVWCCDTEGFQFSTVKEGCACDY